MIDMTGEMKELLDRAHADGFSCILGTADKGGQPQLSLKGSVMVFDSETLAYWERSKLGALDKESRPDHTIMVYARV